MSRESLKSKKNRISEIISALKNEYPNSKYLPIKFKDYEIREFYFKFCTHYLK